MLSQLSAVAVAPASSRGVVASPYAGTAVPTTAVPAVGMPTVGMPTVGMPIVGTSGPVLLPGAVGEQGTGLPAVGCSAVAGVATGMDGTRVPAARLRTLIAVDVPAQGDADPQPRTTVQFHTPLGVPPSRRPLS